MGTSQRVSRGFHRLALFLAAIPFLVGIGMTIYHSYYQANHDLRDYQHVVCAHQHIERVKKQLPPAQAQAPSSTPALDELLKHPPENSPPKADQPRRLLTDEEVLRAGPLEENPFHLLFSPDATRLNLQRMGCADLAYATVSLGDARNPQEFSWLLRLGYYLAMGIAITLAISLGLYVLIRAIGWVIGGFAAS